MLSSAALNGDKYFFNELHQQLVRTIMFFPERTMATVLEWD